MVTVFFVFWLNASPPNDIKSCLCDCWTSDQKDYALIAGGGVLSANEFRNSNSQYWYTYCDSKLRWMKHGYYFFFFVVYMHFQRCRKLIIFSVEYG